MNRRNCSYWRAFDCELSMLDNIDALACVHPPPDFDPDNLVLPKTHATKWRMCSLALDASGQCNMRCSYCAESATMPRRKPMSALVFSRALRFLFMNLPPNASPSLRFGSGEPLLAAPLLEQSAVESQRLSDEFRLAPPQFFLTTNGTLLDKKMLRMFTSPEWHVKVSLDGPPHLHDAHRKYADGRGTSRKVVDAVKKLYEVIGDRLSITAVLSPGADPAEVFEFCESLKVAQIELLPVAESAQGPSFTSDDLRRYRSFVAAYARDLARGHRRSALSRLSNMIPRALGFGSQRYRCGAGRSLYAAGPDGSLYPCFRMVGVPYFQVGSIFSKIDDNALSRFRQTTGRSFLKRAACRVCWARALCNGPCFALTGLMHLQPGNNSIQCAYTRIDATEAVQLVSTLQNTSPRRLLEFLPVDLSSAI